MENKIPKKIRILSIRRWIFVVIAVFALIGIFYTVVFSVKFYQYASATPVKYRTQFGDQSVEQIFIDDETLGEIASIESLRKNFVDMFFDTAQALIGENSQLPSHARIVLHLRFSLDSKGDNRLAAYYDYLYYCHLCDSFPLYRLNLVYDTAINQWKFISIFYRTITVSEYATYNEIEEFDER